MSSVFDVKYALVRPLSSEFERALSQETPETPVDLKLARSQHEAYVDLLRRLLTSVIEVC